MRLTISKSSKCTSQWLTSRTVLLIVLFGGCSDSAVVVKPEEGGLLPPANPSTIVVAEKQPQIIPAGQKSWLDTEALPYTTWYAQYLNGKCIGFSQFTVATSETQGSNLLRLTKRDVLEIAATSTNPVQRREIVLESLEQPDGQFRRYTESSRIDDSISESSSELQRETLTTTKTADGKPTVTRLQWPAGAWGPLGVIAILRQKPMQPDEYRTAKIFVPPLNKIVNVEFKSKKLELTTLPGGVVSELLLVETRFLTDEASSLTKNWVNKAGEIVKSVSEGGFTMFQTTRDEAERIDGEIRAAQLIATKIPVRATPNQLRTTRLTFSIDSANADPFGMLSKQVNQQVKSLSALGAEVTIHRAIATDPIPDGVLQDPPNESHRLKFIEDTLELQEFLSEFPVASPDALFTASKLTESVFRKLKKTPLSRHFSTPTQAIPWAGFSLTKAIKYMG